MAKFHQLRVTDIHKTIRDAVVLTLEPQDGADFSFVQGQYLTFRQTIEGQDIRRSYSICAGRDDGVLQVGIKHVDGGAFSTWANSEIKIGDYIDALPPMGKFHTNLSADHQKHYLCFAGGSGITPILSIIKTTLAAEPLARITLIYANRRINTIMFREELEDLKNSHIGRLNILHILEDDAQEIDLFTGRLDREKLSALFQNWIRVADMDTVFICGPEPMMLTISDSLVSHGMEKSDIKFELFASSQPGRLDPKHRPETRSATVKTTQAAVTVDGATRSFDMSRDMSILEAALANDLDAPFACKAGVCSTCRCKVIEGEVEMLKNHALEDYEVERGYILSCQSYPLSDKVVVDYDVH